MASQRFEELANEAFRCPVGETDASPGLHDACHLRGSGHVVGREHDAERRQYRVEARIFERQRFDVGNLEGDVEALGACAFRAAIEQRRYVIGRRDDTTATRCGKCRVTVAGGDVEHVLVVFQVAGLGEHFADDLQRGADDGVIAAAPGGLLTQLEGGKIDGRVHFIETPAWLMEPRSLRVPCVSAIALPERICFACCVGKCGCVRALSTGARARPRAKAMLDKMRYLRCRAPPGTYSPSSRGRLRASRRDAARAARVLPPAAARRT